MQINENYRIEADDLNYILLKIYQKKDETYDYKPIGYYANMQQALIGMVNRDLRETTGFLEYKMIMNRLDELEKDIKKFLKNI